jgi:hypothetical protein
MILLEAPAEMSGGYDWTSYFIILFSCALLLFFNIHDNSSMFCYVYVLHLFILSIPPFVSLMFMGITYFRRLL